MIVMSMFDEPLVSANGSFHANCELVEVVGCGAASGVKVAHGSGDWYVSGSCARTRRCMADIDLATSGLLGSINSFSNGPT